jgi:hypothetical protein
MIPTHRSSYRGGQGPRVFENSVLRGMFGPRREEVKGGRRKLRNEELKNLCLSPSAIISAVKSGWISEDM